MTAHRGPPPAAAGALPPLAPATRSSAPAAPAPIAQQAPGDLAATVQDALDTPIAPNAPSAPEEPVAHAAALARVDDARPILPPRADDVRAPTMSARSLWRHWPTVVIVIAALAIAAAVVLMLWPPARDASEGTRRLPPPPAPERMDTNPLPQPPGSTPPPPSGSDPWSSRGVVPQPVPPPSDPPIAPPIDDPDAPGALGSLDPDDPRLDPFASPRGRRGGLGGRGGGRFVNPFAGGNTLGDLGSAQLMLTMLGRLCERAHACGGAVDQMCALVDHLQPLPPVPSWAAAQRCMQAIDEVDVCGASASLQLDFTRVFATVQDCVDMMSC